MASVGVLRLVSLLGEQMDKLIEDQELLTIGKKTFDVSNVAVGRKKIARRVWDAMVVDYTREISEAREEDKQAIEKAYAIIVSDLYDSLGLYLIRQQGIVLERRFSFMGSIIDFIRRYLLTIKYINKSNEDEYNKFQEWAHFNITGTKKKDLETDNLIIKMERAAVEELQKVYPDQGQLMDVYRTFVTQTVGAMNIPVPLQKA